MKFLSYVLIYSLFYGGNEDIFDILEDYRIEDEEKSNRVLKNNFPRNSPLPYSNLDKNYLLRKYQHRNNYNHLTNMTFNGLQKKAGKEYRNETKRMHAQKEQKIKEAFAKKITSKTRQKRHHSRHSNKRYWE